MKKKKKRIKLFDILMFILLISSIVIFIYPFVQNELNTFLDQRIINHYQNNANEANQKEMSKQKKINQKISEEKTEPGISNFNKAINDNEAGKEKKAKKIDYYQSHTIGVLYIPKIKAKMPIFDLTNDLLLQKGSSLLEGSSFPGKENNLHSVISAHRGLPEAKLFTDLPKMNKKDKFFIEINGETLAYEIFETKVVDPTDTAALKIREGQNLVTLLTCTPYMINTHRLLVTGKQVPFNPEKDQTAIKKISTWEKYRMLLLTLFIFFLISFTAFILWFWYRRKKISSTLYSLKLILLDQHNQPISRQLVNIETTSNKKTNLSLMTDKSGQLEIPKLLGNRYTLTIGNLEASKQTICQIKIKKIKDNMFTPYVKKNSNIRLLKQDEQYILNNLAIKKENVTKLIKKKRRRTS